MRILVRLNISKNVAHDFVLEFITAPYNDREKMEMPMLTIYLVVAAYIRK